MSAPPEDHLLTVRAALVLLLATLTGLAAGALTFASSRSLASAALAGGAAAGGALALATKLIR